MASCSASTKSIDYKKYQFENNGDIEEIRSRMVADLYDMEADPSEYLAQLCDIPIKKILGFLRSTLNEFLFRKRRLIFRETEKRKLCLYCFDEHNSG